VDYKINVFYVVGAWMESVDITIYYMFSDLFAITCCPNIHCAKKVIDRVKNLTSNANVTLFLLLLSIEPYINRKLMFQGFK